MNQLPLIDSDDSQCSVSSRSAREMKQRACLYFYSDKSTAVVKDIRPFITTEPKWGEEHLITWDGVQERVRVVAVGGKDSGIKEAQEVFEKLSGKDKMSPRKAIQVLQGEHPGPSRRRRCVKVERSQNPAKNLPSIHFNENFTPLADAIGNAIRVGDEDWFNPQAPVPLVPEVVRTEEATERRLTDLDARESIDSQLANAADDRERGCILMEHARKFLGKGPSEMTMLLHPSFNVYVSKSDKIAAVSSGTTPKKLQEQLMLKVFGKEYIIAHSACGQRRSRGGNPAADVESMEAIDAYVKVKFRGQEVPKISKTFNNLAKNLRVTKGYQAGKYRYVKRKAVKEANGLSSHA